MSDDLGNLGGSLTPEENSFFESGGKTEIPGGEKVAEPEKITTEKTATDAPGDKAAEPAKVKADKVEKMISLSALHEERGRRKAIETEKRAMETQLAELRGKFSIIEKLNAPKEPDPPTTETDIFGVVNNTVQTVADIQKRMKADDEAKKAEGEHQTLVNTYRMDAAQFRAKSPDFDAAYNHLLNSRADELRAMGYNDPAQLHQALTNDEVNIAKQAAANGASAAEIIYNLAKLRGYAKPEPKPDPDEAAKAAAAASKAASDKIETINRGQAANKSLSNTGGSAGDGDMTGEMLLKLPMDEFEAWCTKNPAKAKRLMGG